MIVGIGIDIVPIERIVSLWRRHGARLCESIFTPGELAACGIQKDSSGIPTRTELTFLQAKYLAERFAGKEATIKVMGLDYTVPFEFSEIDICGSGTILIHLSGVLETLAASQGINRLTGCCSLFETSTIACIIGESHHV